MSFLVAAASYATNSYLMEGSSNSNQETNNLSEDEIFETLKASYDNADGDISNGYILEADAGSDLAYQIATGVVGFGDAISLGGTKVIRGMWRKQFWNGNNAVHDNSTSYTTGKVIGAAWGGAATGAKSLAVLGSTRLGRTLKVNNNRYLRFGPGKMPKNGLLPASHNAPRMSIGKGPNNPHMDLRIKFFSLTL